jgi:hypothetical protein
MIIHIGQTLLDDEHYNQEYMEDFYEKALSKVDPDYEEEYLKLLRKEPLKLLERAVLGLMIHFVGFVLGVEVNKLEDVDVYPQSKWISMSTEVK